MGLRAEIDVEITQAFANDLADAVKPFTATRKTTKIDFITNKPTTTTTTYQGQGVFGSYRAYEIDGQAILANDVKLTCLQSQCGQPPSNDDVINGYRVVAVAQDPVKATWTIQLRKTG